MNDSKVVTLGGNMRIRIQYILLICIIFCTGCTEKAAVEDSVSSAKELSVEVPSAEKDFFAMDTYMQVTAYGEQAKEAVAQAQTRVEELDSLLSTGIEDSEVSILNDNGEGTLSKEAFYLMMRSMDIWKMTDGAFNPAVYQLMVLWGFTTGQYQVPEEEAIKRQLAYTNPEDITLYEDAGKVEFAKEGIKIDFGGIAKGYTSEQIIEIFREYNIESGMVSLGGNVQVLGEKTDGSLWRVAIQNPDSEEPYLGILETKDKAVITSGGYERYFEQDEKIYHHILDPQTGYPAESGLKSVTVVSEDGVLADGLSTALFVMGLGKAKEFFIDSKEDFDVILWTDEGTLYVSEGIADSFDTDYDMQVIRKDGD